MENKRKGVQNGGIFHNHTHFLTTHSTHRRPTQFSTFSSALENVYAFALTSWEQGPRTGKGGNTQQGDTSRWVCTGKITTTLY